MKKFGRVVGATAAFWAILLFGPMVVALWNALDPYSAKQGSLVFLVISLAAQAASAWVAYLASKRILGGSGGMTVTVNAIVAALVMVFLVFVAANSTREVISDVATIAALVLAIVDNQK